MEELTVYTNEEGIYLEFDLEEADGSLYNLTSIVDITLKTAPKGGSVSGIGSYISGDISIENAVSGICKLLVASEDFTDPGRYNAQIVLSGSASIERTEKFKINVKKGF